MVMLFEVFYNGEMKVSNQIQIKFLEPDLLLPVEDVSNPLKSATFARNTKPLIDLGFLVGGLINTLVGLSAYKGLPAHAVFI